MCEDVYDAGEMTRFEHRWEIGEAGGWRDFAEVADELTRRSPLRPTDGVINHPHIRASADPDARRSSRRVTQRHPDVVDEVNSDHSINGACQSRPRDHPSPDAQPEPQPRPLALVFASSLVGGPFPQTFRETLALHIADRHKTGGANLFESSWKKPYSTRGVRALLTRYATAAGLANNMPSHRLRHFLFTWLKTQGIHDPLIQPYSGHASRQSLEIYSRLAITDAQASYDHAIGRFPV